MSRKRPVIGIFTLPARGGGWNAGRFGNRSPFMRELVRAARARGARCYVFGPADIDWENQIFRGSVPSLDGSWRPGDFPPPDVVYDRIPSVRSEGRADVIETKERLRALTEGRYFNPGFISKLALYQWMRQSRLGRRLMPATEPAADFGQIEKMLQRCGTIYLKPFFGSLGRGIVRVDRIGPGSYLVRLPRTDRADRWIRVGDDSLQTILDKHVRWGSYLVQRGLRLARVNDRSFDIRVLVQKNIRGRWLVASAVARMAHLGSAVSNLARGGEIIRPSAALMDAFGWNRPQALGKVARIRRLAVNVARAIDKASGQSHGELGLDLAVDQDGRTWLLEANAKPAREPHFESEPRVARISTRRLIGYCFFLVSRFRRRG